MKAPQHSQLSESTKNPLLSVVLPEATIDSVSTKTNISLTNKSITNSSPRPPAVSGSPRPMKKPSSDIDKIKNQQASWNVKSSVRVVESEMIGSHGENALLHDIERQDEEDAVKGRDRTGSVFREVNVVNTLATTTPIGRNRKASLDYSETMGAFDENTDTNWSTEIRKFIDFLQPKFKKRMHYYSIAFVLMALVLITSRFRSLAQWLLLFVSGVLLDGVTTTIDECIFIFIVDKIFINHYDTAYLLHGFNGPLGLIMMLIVVDQFSERLSGPELVPMYQEFISSITIILLCLCVKNYYVRKHYITLLEKRFAPRLFKLETYTILLSELATAKPPKRFMKKTGMDDDDDTTATTESSHKYGSITEQYFNPFMHTVKGVFTDLVNITASNNDDVVPASNTPSGGIVAKPTQKLFRGMSAGSAHGLGIGSGGGGSTPHTHQIAGRTGRSPSVASNAQGRRNSNAAATTTPAPSAKDAGLPVGLSKPSFFARTNSFFASLFGKPSGQSQQEEDLADIRKRKTFWQSAAKLSSNAGTLRISTYNGIVFIRKRSQAKDFGKMLYKHLSKKGKIIVTYELIETLLYEVVHRTCADGDTACQVNPIVEGVVDQLNGDIEMPPFQSPYSPVGDMNSDRNNSGRNEDTTPLNSMKVKPKEDTSEHDALLYETALELFDPLKTEIITETSVVNALLLIYKEQRFAASSLNDYGEIHQSLHNVIGVVFWVVMAIVLQIFIGLSLFSYILPFLTMFLTVSFAMGLLFGNLFIACCFVFFMCPYDIGNKIVIGVTNDKITGYVRGVSLLYTTINTTTNQIMKIPNHLLFHEKICNLQESNGVVYQIDIAFNIDSSTLTQNSSSGNSSICDDCHATTNNGNKNNGNNNSDINNNSNSNNSRRGSAAAVAVVASDEAIDLLNKSNSPTESVESPAAENDRAPKENNNTTSNSSTSSNSDITSSRNTVPFTSGKAGHDENSSKPSVDHSVTFDTSNIDHNNNNSNDHDNHDDNGGGMLSRRPSSSTVSSLVTTTTSSTVSPVVSNQAKINTFIELVKHYILVEHKEDWASCSCNCANIDTKNNSIDYTLYATHRDNYQDMKKPGLAKTALLLYIRELQVNMGLVYEKISQPVAIIFQHGASKNDHNIDSNVQRALSGNGNNSGNGNRNNNESTIYGNSYDDDEHYNNHNHHNNHHRRHSHTAGHDEEHYYAQHVRNMIRNRRHKMKEQSLLLAATSLRDIPAVPAAYDHSNEPGHTASNTPSESDNDGSGVQRHNHYSHNSRFAKNDKNNCSDSDSDDSSPANMLQKKRNSYSRSGGNKTPGRKMHNDIFKKQQHSDAHSKHK